jgi:uncharacterized protein DUF5666
MPMTRRLVIGLAGVALVVALAVGAWGVAYAQGQTAGRAEVAAARADFLQGRPGGNPGAGGGAGGAAGPGAAAGGPGGGPGGRAGQAPVAGTIDKVNGTTLTVATETGSVTVTLGEQTRIVRQAAASAADLKAGDRVVVIGARAADGTVAAASIQIQPQGQ